MKTKNLFTSQPVHYPSLAIVMGTGAAIALVLICIFIFPIDYAKPEWPKYWYIRPLVIVPFSGAIGGLFFYLMGPLRQMGGWNTFFANLICLVVYVVGLWMGSVLGLVGTLWD